MLKSLATFLLLLSCLITFGQVPEELRLKAENLLIERTGDLYFEYDCFESAVIHNNTYWNDCYDSTYTVKEARRAHRLRSKGKPIGYALTYIITFENGERLETTLSFDANFTLNWPISLPPKLEGIMNINRDRATEIAKSKLDPGIRPWEVELGCEKERLHWRIKNTLSEDDAPSGMLIYIDATSGNIFNTLIWESTRNIPN